MFYTTEIELRKMLRYPPFCDIILIRFSGSNLAEIEKSSNIIYRNLKRYINNENGIVYEPVPSPIDKIKNKYRWRVVIKGKVNSSMIEAINLSFKGTENLKQTSITVDINPNNMN